MQSLGARIAPIGFIGQLLWAAFGMNRPAEKGRTAPAARGAQEIDVYVAMREGVDARNVTGYQDFVDEAPLNLAAMRSA